MAPILIHYHIFKNAGSSVDHALRAHFGDAWTTWDGDSHHDALSPSALAGYLRANPGLRALSSHQAHPPVPWSGCHPLVFLRHPLDRAWSVYNFVAADATQPNSSLARQAGFRGYVAWALGGDPSGVVIRDYQVVHLSSAACRQSSLLQARATPADLEEARAFIDACPAFGLVRRFSDSAALLEKTYGQHFPGFRMAPVRLNTGPQSLATEAMTLDQARQVLGESLFRAFMEQNALDAELYRHAVARFETLLHQTGLGQNET
ncbi:MAG: hypothetical protein AB1899_15375 [Pseudomonadota bacterium]